MKTTYNIEQNSMPVNKSEYNFRNGKIKKEWYSIEFSYKNQNRQTLLINVESKLIEKDNFHISIDRKKLLIIILEQKEISRPIYMHHLSKGISNATKYDRLRSISIPLPGSRYYILDSHLDRKNHRLRIKLGIPQV